MHQEEIKKNLEQTEPSPRGEAIRGHTQNAPRGSRRESPSNVSSQPHRSGIPTVMAIILIGIAMIADLVGLIGLIPFLKPLAIGFGAILGAMLWAMYFALGARSVRFIAIMLITYFMELIPIVSFLPTFTVTAILTCILMSQPAAQKAIQKRALATGTAKA